MEPVEFDLGLVAGVLGRELSETLGLRLGAGDAADRRGGDVERGAGLGEAALD